MRKAMSIKKIAELSGVSVATVSRVINNTGRFSEATRKRVMDIIEEYDYKPNMIAKSLRVSKSKTIGVTVPDISNGFFSEVVSEIEKFFYGHGYSVFICNTNNSEEKEKEYLKSLKAKLVDGVICISGNSEIHENLIEYGVPIVYINNAASKDAYCIESDHYRGGFIAGEALIKRGCKKIVVLTNNKSDRASKDKLRGFEAVSHKYGIEFNSDLIIRMPRIEGNFEDSFKAVNNLLDSNIEFDGIFATNDWRAHGALVALEHRKIPVPQKVKIVGYDGTYVSKYCNPTISTIFQDKKALALKSSEVLLAIMDGRELEDESHILVPVEFIERQTTK